MDPLHATSEATLSPLLVAVLGAAGLASALVLGLGLAAYARRRSTPYLFVALAVGALAARTGVGVLTVMETLPPTEHHLYEHALDVAMAALVVGAVYHARSVREGATAGGGERR